MARWIDQTILHSEDTRGNCMQAAVASILGLPLTDVPHFAADPARTAHYGFLKFLESHGFDVVRDDFHRSFDGYYLACGPTARGTHHMVVMRDGKLAHDPHPSRAGLHKIEFVYSLLPRDPAIHVAACGAAKAVAPLMRKASDGPWESDAVDTEGGWGPYKARQMMNTAGKCLFETSNSDVQCIAEESDEDRHIAWDEQGEADLAYVEALDGFARSMAALLEAPSLSAGDNGR